MSDNRSAEAAEYRRLYGTVRWKRIKQHQLSEHPLCAICLQQEIVEPATVVHHAGGGHKGDLERFWFGPFESLCKPCHDTYGKAEDSGKKLIRFGVDGYPIDD